MTYRSSCTFTSESFAGLSPNCACAAGSTKQATKPTNHIFLFIAKPPPIESPRIAEWYYKRESGFAFAQISQHGSVGHWRGQSTQTQNLTPSLQRRATKATKACRNAVSWS